MNKLVFIYKHLVISWRPSGNEILVFSEDYLAAGNPCHFYFINLPDINRHPFSSHKDYQAVNNPCHLLFTKSTSPPFPSLDDMNPHLAVRDPCLLPLQKSLELQVWLETVEEHHRAVDIFPAKQNKNNWPSCSFTGCANFHAQCVCYNSWSENKY